MRPLKQSHRTSLLAQKEGRKGARSQVDTNTKTYRIVKLSLITLSMPSMGGGNPKISEKALVTWRLSFVICKGKKNDKELIEGQREEGWVSCVTCL